MNKVAVVIAGGSGMGADAAKTLHKKGFKVAIMSSSNKSKILAAKLKGIGYVGSNLEQNDLKKVMKK